MGIQLSRQQAAERDRLRRSAERDAETLATSPADDDLEALAQYAATVPMGDIA
ncbi:hypothetical protein [Nocardia sp. NPDC058666]|uniref:hypothetical protein n=1 Tax=unclassified Nocardia TaxID=2637762 RepID=UPI003648F383